MLTTGDAVAAIFRLDDGRFLMQLRDERPDIWFPGCWGCFGGAVDEGETPEQALRRELLEELEFRLGHFEYVMRFDFEVARMGLTPCYRTYFQVPITRPELGALVLHEGQAMAPMSIAELAAARVTPYDAFALKLLVMSRSAITLRAP